MPIYGGARFGGGPDEAFVVSEGWALGAVQNEEKMAKYRARDAVFMTSLRHPINRILSRYWYEVRTRPPSATRATVVRYIASCEFGSRSPDTSLPHRAPPRRAGGRRAARRALTTPLPNSTSGSMRPSNRKAARRVSGRWFQTTTSKRSLAGKGARRAWGQATSPRRNVPSRVSTWCSSQVPLPSRRGAPISQSYNFATANATDTRPYI